MQTLSFKFATMDQLTVAFGTVGVAGVNGSASLGPTQPTTPVHLTTLTLGGGGPPPYTSTFSGELPAPPAGVAIRRYPGHGTLGAFSTMTGLSRRTLPLHGTLLLCLYSPYPCTQPVSLPLTQNGTAGVGLGGSLIRYRGGVYFSLSGAPWTVGPTTVTFPTFMGSATSMLNTTGSHMGPNGLTSSTVGSGGQLQIVTPIRVVSSAGTQLNGFATMRIQFGSVVPEPRSFVLFLSGAALLFVLGFRRMR
jgi:hypothetical protein